MKYPRDDTCLAENRSKSWYCSLYNWTGADIDNAKTNAECNGSAMAKYFVGLMIPIASWKVTSDSC